MSEGGKKKKKVRERQLQQKGILGMERTVEPLFTMLISISLWFCLLLFNTCQFITCRNYELFRVGTVNTVKL